MNANTVLGGNMVKDMWQYHNLMGSKTVFETEYLKIEMTLSMDFPSSTFLIYLYAIQNCKIYMKILNLSEDYLCFLWVEVLCLTVSAISMYFWGTPYWSNKNKEKQTLTYIIIL